MILSILSQKGGVGKSTLAWNLGAAFALPVDRGGHGMRVLLADGDPQGSLLAWADAAERPGGSDALPFDIAPADTLDGLAGVAGAFDIVLLDGPPRLDRRLGLAVALSDVVLLPVRPSPLDIWASRPLADVLLRHRAEHGRPDAALVVSQAAVGTRLGAEAAGALAGLGLPVLTTTIAHRIAFPEAALAGTSVLELEPAGKAAEEIRALAHEIRSTYGPSS